MRNLLVFLIALLLTGAAQAAGQATPDGLRALMDVSQVDQTVGGKILDYLLGPKALFRELGGYSNIIALTFACIAGTFIMISGAVRTAHDGQVLGKQWSTVWLPVRTAIGFGLLMPLAHSNISAIQEGVIWTAKVGMNGAETVWNRSVGKIMGGADATIPAPIGALSFTEKVWNASVCVESLQYGGVQNADVVRDGRTWNFGVGGDSQCGTIDIDISTTQEIKNFGKKALGYNAAEDTKNIALNSMLATVDTHVKNVRKIAHAYVYPLSAGGLIGGGQVLSDINDPMNPEYEKITGLTRVLNAEAQRFAGDVFLAAKKAIAGSAWGHGFEDRLRAGGWVFAGNYALQLARISDTAAEVVSKTLQSARDVKNPDVCQNSASFMSELWDRATNWGASPCSAQSMKDDMAGAGKIFSRVMKEKSINAPTGDDIDFVKSMGDSTGNFMNEAGGKAAQAILRAVASGSGSDASGTSGIDAMMGRDPFATAQEIGQTARHASIGIVAAYAMSSGIAAGAKEAPVPVGIGGAAVHGTLEAIKTLVSNTAMMISGAGFVLGYVVPMEPALVYIMTVVGWFITVMAAFLIAPLAVAQMVLPEGEGIIGTRLERILAVIAGVAVTPFLIVVALFGAILVARVAFFLINSVFWSMASSMSSFDLLSVAFFISFYAAIIFLVCTISVSLIYRLPKMILDQFSAGMGGAFGEQEIGGRMERTASAAGGSAQQTAQQTMSNIGNYRRQVGAANAAARTADQEIDR